MGRESHQAFGRLLKSARDRCGMSARDVADAIGYKSAGAINNWEGGATPPDPETCFRLEHALGCEPGELTQVLGFVPAGAETLSCTVEVAIMTDSQLDDDERDVLLLTYRRFTRESR